MSYKRSQQLYMIANSTNFNNKVMCLCRHVNVDFISACTHMHTYVCTLMCTHVCTYVSAIVQLSYKVTSACV